MGEAVLIITVLAVVFGLLLGFAAVRFKVEEDPVVDQVDKILPQTQCGQCTYPGCRPYAEAIVAGEADINQCPPGGEAVIIALADLLGADRLFAFDPGLFEGAVHCVQNRVGLVGLVEERFEIREVEAGT